MTEIDIDKGHRQESTDNNRYECKICNIILSSKRSYRGHIRSESHINTVKSTHICRECNYQTKSECRYNRHLQSKKHQYNIEHKKNNIIDNIDDNIELIISNKKNENTENKSIKVLKLRTTTNKTLNTKRKEKRIEDESNSEEEIQEEKEEQLITQTCTKCNIKCTTTLDNFVKHYMNCGTNDMMAEIRSSRNDIKRQIESVKQDNKRVIRNLYKFLMMHHLKNPELKPLLQYEPNYKACMEIFFNSYPSHIHNIAKTALAMHLNDNERFINAIVNAIVYIIKKDDRHKQSVFVSDISRLTHLVKNIEPESSWTRDGRGELFFELIVAPLFDFVYQELINFDTYISENHKELTTLQIDFGYDFWCKLKMFITYISNYKYKNTVLQKVAPKLTYYNYENTTNAISIQN